MCKRLSLLSLITFGNSLDPDQDQQNVGPDLDPNSLTLMIFLKEFFEKVDFEKNQQTTNNHTKITQHVESLHDLLKVKLRSAGFSDIVVVGT